ncbi:MAG: hypothetical protein ACREUE_15645 [Panacagrimonas sp.]
MHCELLVPGLFEKKSSIRLGGLERLLARGRRKIEGSAPQRLECWLRDAFSLGVRAIPAGALSLFAANRDPGRDSWLRADPVHLQVMRDHAIVVPAEALTISQAEADAFCASLNQHFTGVMQVVALDPRRWVARLFDKEIELDDVPALQLAGRQIPLFRGRDVEVTEIQMVLHAHAANEARDARGEPTVNSLWLWGAGRARKATSRWRGVLADEPLAMGLAMLSRTRYRSLHPGAAQWLQSAPEDGRHLVVLDALRTPTMLMDLDKYHAALAALEKNWFAPLLAALRAGRVGMITLHVPDGAEAVSFETIRGDLRRFWRVAKPIEHYA